MFARDCSLPVYCVASATVCQKSVTSPACVCCARTVHLAHLVTYILLDMAQAEEQQLANSQANLAKVRRWNSRSPLPCP